MNGSAPCEAAAGLALGAAGAVDMVLTRLGGKESGGEAEKEEDGCSVVRRSGGYTRECMRRHATGRAHRHESVKGERTKLALSERLRASQSSDVIPRSWNWRRVIGDL